MKKIILPVLVIIFGVVFFVGSFGQEPAKPGPMRVLVEGEEEIQATKEALKAQGTAAAPVIKEEKKFSAKKLKQIAQKSSLENEIIDAMIAKISDMEDEQKKQQARNLFIYGALIIMLVLIIALRSGKPKDKSQK